MKRYNQDASERGSILISMMVLMVLLSLSLLLVLQQVASQDRSTTTRAFTRALFVADAGLNEAAYRMQTKVEAAPSAVGASTSSGPQPLAGPNGYSDTYSYTVTKTGPLSYLIRSRGTADGRARTVTQEYIENPLFPFAVFADKAIHFQGNGEIGSYTSNASGVPAVQDTSSNTGYIGTNGALTTNGGVTSGGVGLFNNDGGASCSGPVCTNMLPGFPKNSPFAIDSQDAIVQAAITACKNAQGGILKDYVASKEGMLGFPKLAAGVNCFRSVVMDQTIAPFPGSVANPVKVYVDGGKIEITTSNIGLGAFGPAPAFQVYAVGATTEVLIQKEGRFVGALWAPRSDCKERDSNIEGVNVFGSMVCGTFGKDKGTKGNGNFKSMYDNSLGGIGSGIFTLGRYAEENA